MKYKIESCTAQAYCLDWKVYYKRGFFSPWVQFGKNAGYLKLDECIAEIGKHKTAMLELDKLNDKNLKNKELKENL